MATKWTCATASPTPNPVKLDPPDVPSMFPSLDRCVKVAPKKTTTYTFTADDGKGNTKTAQLTIEVH